MFSNQIETNYWNKWKNQDLDLIAINLKSRKYQGPLNFLFKTNIKNLQADL